MPQRNWLTKLQVIVGLVLVTIPILSPIVFSIIRLLSYGTFQIDYLMPAELGVPVLIGANLLLWAAIRSRSYLKWIAWSLGIAIVLIFGGQGLAVLTGLASGRIDASGWQYGIVAASIIGYDIAVVGLIIGGVLLCRHLFQVEKQ